MIPIRFVQEKELETFRRFDALCREQGLRYYLLGGSMLGAIRHQGCIPWDDDIDVGMPRPDYERFLTFAGERFEKVFNFKNDHSCSYDFTKLYVPLNYEGRNLEAFVDVFPLDGCPSAEPGAIKRYYRRYALLRLMKNTHFMTLEGKRLPKRAIVRLCRLIPLTIWNRWMERYLVRHSFDSSPARGLFSGHWEEREIMPAELYGEPREYPFEGMLCLGVAEPDEYLTRLYGDYMQLPPEDQRKTHLEL